jgi:hypothetical protein
VSDFALRAASGKWRSPFAPETIIFLGLVEIIFAGERRRGHAKVSLEWTLVCVSYNLKRLFALKNLAVAA